MHDWETVDCVQQIDMTDSVAALLTDFIFLATKTQLYKSLSLILCVRVRVRLSVVNLKFYLIPHSPRFPIPHVNLRLPKVTHHYGYPRFQGIKCMQFHEVA